eukprot:4116205-Alexandrium_andersonii.AAC.1
MSASLVGSEMCIRDSRRPAAPQVTATRQPLTSGCIRHAGEHGWDAAPVSYTHLTLPTICSV